MRAGKRKLTAGTWLSRKVKSLIPAMQPLLSLGLEVRIPLRLPLASAIKDRGVLKSFGGTFLEEEPGVSSTWLTTS